MKKACLSVDVDTVSTVLKAHGIKKRVKEPTFSKVLPRFDSFFKKKKIKATFFVVGEYLQKKENIKTIQMLYSHGHEIASHSFTHPIAFSKLKIKQKEREIIKSEKAIKERTGKKPVGFRTPGWDIDEETMNLLEKRNYLYDSSILPSWASRVFKYYLRLTSKDPKIVHPIGNWKHAFAPQAPYNPNQNAVWKKGKMKILEVPISTTPILRLPFVATAFFTLGSRSFSLALKLSKFSHNPLNIQLHSVELLDPKKDIKVRFLKKICHSPTKKPFKEKIQLYKKMVSALSKEVEFVTLKELVNEYRKGGIK